MKVSLFLIWTGILFINSSWYIKGIKCGVRVVCWLHLWKHSSRHPPWTAEEGRGDAVLRQNRQMRQSNKDLCSSSHKRTILTNPVQLLLWAPHWYDSFIFDRRHFCWKLCAQLAGAGGLLFWHVFHFLPVCHGYPGRSQHLWRPEGASESSWRVILPISVPWNPNSGVVLLAESCSGDPSGDVDGHILDHIFLPGHFSNHR